MPGPIWLTYAWKDNEDGDFDHLVAELGRAGVTAMYDKIALIPGQPLWDQIADQITSGDVAGWAYLVTPASIASPACQEELAYALNRALTASADFPLIGLVHQVSIRDLPPALRTRLCVDLSAPGWAEAVLAALERRAPRMEAADPGPFRIKVHRSYGGDPSMTAVEIQPRFGQLSYWRIAFPAGLPEPRIGTGPIDGGGLSGLAQSYIEGAVELDGKAMKFAGSGDSVGASTSAYLVFPGAVPDRIAFGNASQAFGLPDDWVVWNLHARA